MAALIKYYAGGIIITCKISACAEGHSNCFKIILRCNYFPISWFRLHFFPAIGQYPCATKHLWQGLLQLLLHQQFLFVSIHFLSAV